MAKSPTASKKIRTDELFAEQYPGEALKLSSQISFVPEMKRLTRSVTFAISFSTIAPVVLISLNLVITNVLHWTPISDPVMITFTAASSLSAILQPVVARILDKMIDKVTTI